MVQQQQQHNISKEGEQQQQPTDMPRANEEPILERQLEQETETSCYQNLKQNLSYEPKYLKVAHVNVNGLLTLSKLQEVKILLSETKFDMLGITETKLSSRTTDEKLNIDGYKFVRRDRVKEDGGLFNCITFQISYISASDLNRFPRSCKSHTK